jgi:arylamine N-acetyltransferase
VSAPAPGPAWADRYLALLGLPREAPGLAALARLTRAQILTVPFENSHALLRRRAAGDEGPVPPVDLEAVLASWEARRAGGVCFEHAAAFGTLLRRLGYDVTDIAGEISFPGSHQALVVALGGRRYLLDVGEGCPFFEPIPLDEVVEVRRAGLAFRFRVDADDPGLCRLEREVDGAWSLFCRFWLRPQPPEAREAAYQRHHTARLTWVTNALVLVACRADEVISFRELRLTRFTPEGKVVAPVEDAAAWARLPVEAGIPGMPIAEVVGAWAAVNGKARPTGL